jgi:UDP-apiose/xylose synthase
MRLLILGCGGFIGSHLVSHILDNAPDIAITGYDRDRSKLGDTRRFDFRHGDIYTDPCMSGEIELCDAVVFLASLCNPSLYMSRPVETIKSNFIGPASIVDMCAKHRRRLISFSTCEVYGMTVSSMVGDNYTRPEWYVQHPGTTPSILGPIHVNRWSYAAAKQLLDRYIYAHHCDTGMPFTIIRPYNFFGSRMDFLPTSKRLGSEPRILASFLGALKHHQPLRLVDGGLARRVYTDIEDAVAGVLAIIRHPEQADGKIMHIANPANEATVVYMAELMRFAYSDETGTPLSQVVKQSPLKSVSAESFYGPGYEDCDRRVPDISAMTALGWKPQYDLQTTVYRAVSSYLKEEE